MANYKFENFLKKSTSPVNQGEEITMIDIDSLRANPTNDNTDDPIIDKSLITTDDNYGMYYEKPSLKFGTNNIQSSNTGFVPSYNKDKFKYIENDIETNYLNEYESDKIKKTKLFLHHTGDKKITTGNPYIISDIYGKNRITTGWIIGGLILKPLDSDEQNQYNAHSTNLDVFNGKILKLYDDDDFWSYTYSSNDIEKYSVSVTICNPGDLTFNNDLKDYLWHDDVIYPYDKKSFKNTPFKSLITKYENNTYYQKYTSEQIASLKEWILYNANKYSIQLERNIYDVEWCKGFKGKKGKQLLEKFLDPNYHGIFLHSHVANNVELYPQQELLDMLNSL